VPMRAARMRVCRCGCAGVGVPVWVAVGGAAVGRGTRETGSVVVSVIRGDA
jgi:hypothetical protein